jgi:ubiquitin carboxyl-terminal hydrolase 22/27/51
MLKAYFLSDKHNRHVCTNGSKGLAVGRPFLGSDNGSVNGTTNGSGIGGDRERGCMCCEMDRAFEEVSQLQRARRGFKLKEQFYNEDKSPFGPITMLYTMWHASAELEGYGQQGQSYDIAMNVIS